MLHASHLEGKTSVISWLPHGRAFRVKNKEMFVSSLMSAYFKQAKFKSFQRQLNLWGFTRITDGADAGAYNHKHFLRSSTTTTATTTTSNSNSNNNQPA